MERMGIYIPSFWTHECSCWNRPPVWRCPPAWCWNALFTLAACCLPPLMVESFVARGSCSLLLIKGILSTNIGIYVYNFIVFKGDNYNWNINTSDNWSGYNVKFLRASSNNFHTHCNARTAQTIYMYGCASLCRHMTAHVHILSV